jgi:hypothetical protein
MAIPSWLASMTGAQAFANNPLNGFQPTMGDAMQGIGHSLAEHYRQGGLAPAPAGTPPIVAPTPPSGLPMDPGMSVPPAQPQVTLPPVNFQQALPLSSKSMRLIADLFKQ